MFTRPFLRGAVLVALALQMFASVAEAAVCEPCPAKEAGVCPSIGGSADTSVAIPGNGDDSPSPASHDSGDERCSLCPICLAPGIEFSALSLFPEDCSRRFAPPDFRPVNDAPSFPLLRPPIS